MINSVLAHGDNSDEGIVWNSKTYQRKYNDEAVISDRVMAYDHFRAYSYWIGDDIGPIPASLDCDALTRV